MDRIFKRMKPGTPMGTPDGGHPEAYSHKDISAVHDAMADLEDVFGSEAARKVWDTLPHAFRMDYNWSKWTYVPRRK